MPDTRTSAAPARTEPHRGGRWALVGVELFVSVAAIYGGVGLMRDGMGMPQEWLDATPFDSWVLPGLALLLVVALPMSLAAVLELVRSPWAYAGSLAAGLLQVGWIVVQVLVMQRFFFLQPVMAGFGVVVALLAWWTHRGEPLVPTATVGGAAGTA